MSTKRTLIFDLDGTLIECGKYYHETNQLGAQYLADVTGLPVEHCKALMEHIDLAAMTRPNGFKADRYPKSFAAAALAACHIVSDDRPEVIPYATHMLAMSEIGKSVFSAPYDEYPGVRPVLLALKADGWQLVLYTKGDSEVQRNKIMQHGYGELFDQCVITLTKDEATLRKVVAGLAINVAESIYVGDSLKDDVGPAKALGLKTVRVTPLTEWSYDTGVAEPDATITGVAQLLDVLPSLLGAEAIVA